MASSQDDYPEGKPSDLVIAAFEVPDVECLIVRTLPNREDKKSAQYENAPYFTVEAMDRIAKSSVVHLVVDVPSVDRAEDDGTLRNHRTFWSVPIAETAVVPKSRTDRTISEMAFIPDDLLDGVCSCTISVARFETDAMPSRIVAFR